MQQISISVDNPSGILASGAFGAGALLRLESAAAATGPWSEIGTAAIVAGVTSYNLWDAAGTSGTWYRSRYSKVAPANPSDYSAYSAAFQAGSSGQLLTVDQFRTFVTTSLPDSAIQSLLNDAEQAITARYGAPGTIVDVRRGGGGLVQLSRRAGSISSVAEQWLLDMDSSEAAQAIYAEEFWLAATTLSANDYRLEGDGTHLQRLADGTNPAETFGQYVKVTYVAFDDAAGRKRVQLQLVKLDIAYQPGLAQQTIGTWTEQYASNSAWNYDVEREAILASLAPGWGFA